MSCERYRYKLIAVLASGESSLDGDVAVHLRACVECKKFYETQARLFGAIDSGVRAIVNEAVPASLLPRARARMEEAHWPQFVWRLPRSIVATAMVIVVTSVAIVPWRKPAHDTVITNVSTHVPKAMEARSPTVTPKEIAHAVANAKRGPSHATAAPKEPVAELPEVIVLVEEREAFARFVAKVPVEPLKAVAFTRPAPPQQDLPVEIALLQIESLRMKLLEPAAEE
jgi:hypothetical protein